jgi:hypothetical protein
MLEPLRVLVPVVQTFSQWWWTMAQDQALPRRTQPIFPQGERKKLCLKITHSVVDPNPVRS